MKAQKKKGSRFANRALFGLMAPVLAAGCGGGERESRREEVAVQQEPLQFTHRVRILVFAVRQDFTPTMMTDALAVANPIWDQAGIQFDFSPSDVISKAGFDCSDTPEGNAALAKLGNAYPGWVPVFYCNDGNRGSLEENFLVWSGGGAFSHELGHYFGLNHVHRACWVADDDHLPNPPAGKAEDGCFEVGGWHSVEACIRSKFEGTPLPPGCPSHLGTATGIRDYLLDGDGIADTPVGLHLDPGAGDPCASGYSVPLKVNFSDGSEVNYPFTPTTNNLLSYFSCTPLTLSNTQKQIVRTALFLGNRRHLIDKPVAAWDTSFSDSNGWNAAQYYSTIGFADIDADGRADLCGRGVFGIHCAPSGGTSFPSHWDWNTAFSDANGWGGSHYYSTIKYPNVDGINGTDVCGRGIFGIVCATSDGSNFVGTKTWNGDFSDANGWTAPMHYTTIAFPNLDNTGGADLCGRGTYGIVCATSNGTDFVDTKVWNSAFSNANNWVEPKHYLTIRYPDVNGDQKADVCGRGTYGIVCATNNGLGEFTGTKLWTMAFSDTEVANLESYFGTIAFPDLNGDGAADVCGRASDGIRCGLSDGDYFQNISTWHTVFSNANSFDQAKYYKTFSFPDLDADGSADVCARGIDGMYCAYSNGVDAFVDLHLYSSMPNDPSWGVPEYYSTLKFANVDDDPTPELCGRTSLGVFCELN